MRQSRIIHSFAGLTLERGGAERKAPGFFHSTLTSPDARFVLLHQTAIAVDRKGSPGGPAIAW
jgi:hypothetical protein